MTPGERGRLVGEHPVEPGDSRPAQPCPPIEALRVREMTEDQRDLRVRAEPLEHVVDGGAAALRVRVQQLLAEARRPDSDSEGRRAGASERRHGLGYRQPQPHSVLDDHSAARRVGDQLRQRTVDRVPPVAHAVPDQGPRAEQQDAERVDPDHRRPQHADTVVRDRRAIESRPHPVGEAPRSPARHRRRACGPVHPPTLRRGVAPRKPPSAALGLGLDRRLGLGLGPHRRRARRTADERWGRIPGVLRTGAAGR